MKRVAILGGGISGVAAAYELTKQAAAGADVSCTLFEASDRLGGTVRTERVTVEGAGTFIVELGPDGWVSEKPWARDLAMELGLGGQLVPSNDAERRTLLLRGGTLQAFPEGMRMMVPLNDDAVQASKLLSECARQAYLTEPSRAEELRALAIATEDITVGDFVRRHYGDEVTQTFAGPLLAGVFGGDIEKLSALSVMPSFIKLEREYGSLSVGLRARAASSSTTQQSIFTALRGGNQSLIDAIASLLRATTVRLSTPVSSLTHADTTWTVQSALGVENFDSVMLATPAHVTRQLLSTVDEPLSALHAIPASSAVMVALLYDRQAALPAGFGFLVEHPQSGVHPALLAATFSQQKYPHSVREGCMLLRVFFGGDQVAIVEQLASNDILALAQSEMARLFPELPQAAHGLVQRWPQSLPQYELGHEERVCQIEARAAALPGLHLLGNAYRGVGLPDMVHRARLAAAAIANG
jgi:oxygen-dependent protoporphyrinogen oxidase